MTTELSSTDQGPSRLRLERAPIRGAGPGEPGWLVRYRRQLVVSDAVVIVYATTGSRIIRFGTGAPDVADSDLRLRLSYGVLGLIVAAAWIVALGLADSRSIKIIGEGAEEYGRVIRASVGMFAFLAIAAYLTGLSIARGYVAVAAPVGVILLLVERWMWRRWLKAKRVVGESSRRAVVVGSRSDVVHITEEINRVPTVGLRVVGVCTPGLQSVDIDTTDGVCPLPNVGSLEVLLDDVARGDVDAVVVASGGDRSRETLRQLGWALEGTGTSLLIVPALANVAGSRIHVQPVAGITLMHVEEPRLPRGGQVLKGALDRAGALLMIVVLAPVLLTVGLAVRLGSPGPAFFRQERIGRGGTIFSMWKFRSMRVNADTELESLLSAAGRGDTPLFKLDIDPRVTRVGRIIRKFSLDELPQLFNVLTGQMSLVGPRPQRAAEVELYDELARRRLLAKPGMTGLWQVSGRSDLAWEEAVRRDVYYVENWSFTFDLVLLWRTIWVVTRGAGAR